MACMPAAAGAAGFFWHAVAANPRKTRHAIPKVRFKVFFLTRSFSLQQTAAWNSGFSGRIFGVPRQLAGANFGFHGQAQFNHAAYLRKTMPRLLSYCDVWGRSNDAKKRFSTPLPHSGTDTPPT
jgi:hypothetical protein